MNSNLYEDLLRDIVKEINKLAAEETSSQNSDFDRGYRAGMMVIMKTIQDEIYAFNSPKAESLGLIDVDKWFKGDDFRREENLGQ